MNITILGRHGFIGSALTRKFTEEGHIVNSNPTEKTMMLFNFASTTHPAFEQNPEYHMSEAINSALYLLPFCAKNDIFYVYPSSALVYEKDTAFSKTKQILELIASIYPKTLGLRIFPVYGPGEDKTVIAQWCRAIRKETAPIVYGDGSQARDFIHIDDVVDQIYKLTELRKTGIRDIGTGKLTSFNDIIKTINAILDTDIKPHYMEKPFDYSEGIFSKNPMEANYSIYRGIQSVIDKL